MTSIDAKVGTQNIGSDYRAADVTAPRGLDKAGSGGNGGDATVPDVPQKAAQSGLVMLTFQALLGSIDEKLLKVNGNADPTVLIAEVAALVDELTKKIAEGDVKNKTNQKRAALVEQDKKIKEYERAKQEAEEAQRKAEAAAKKSRGIGGIFGKIFKALNYILAAVSIVAGAALVASGIGAVAGVALIATGALSLANEITQDTTGKGIGGHFAKAVGGNEMWGELGFTIGVTVASGVTMWRSAGKIKELMNSIKGLLQYVGVLRTAAQQTSTAEKIGNGISTTVQLTQSGAMMAQGITGIDAAKKQRAADEAGVHARRTEADSKRFEADVVLLQQFIDVALQVLMNASKQWAAALDPAMEILDDRARTISKARLTA